MTAAHEDMPFRPALHDALSTQFTLPEPEATERLGRWLAGQTRSGDTILLEGPIGAGKTHLARSLIQQLLASSGTEEEVPSPTFTLVQTYEAGEVTILHADLYRLAPGADLSEIGLDEAFGTALCIVEWPDRLSGNAPPDALHVTLRDVAGGSGRSVRLESASPRWAQTISCAEAAVA